MLTVSKKLSPEQKVTYECSGIIDEGVNFLLLEGIDALSEFSLDLYGIKRINSVGIKKWITFFEKFQKKNVKMSFVRVAPAIVEQLVNISNFSCGADILSVVLPFHCKACSQSNFLVKTKAELTNVDLDHTNWNCQSCNKAELEFDDLPDEYLRFWNR